jgi:hypothetical protein
VFSLPVTAEKVLARPPIAVSDRASAVIVGPAWPASRPRTSSSSGAACVTSFSSTIARHSTLTSDKSSECYRNWLAGPDDAMVALRTRASTGSRRSPTNRRTRST